MFEADLKVQRDAMVCVNRNISIGLEAQQIVIYCFNYCWLRYSVGNMISRQENNRNKENIGSDFFL